MLSLLQIVLLTAFGSILAFFVAAAIIHHILKKIESSKFKRVGMPVEVDGYGMNVYTEGKKSDLNDTIVLLSGSGVTSPIYDYKILYSKLTDDYQVAVVEKFGYGYSDVSGLSRDIATMVDQDRRALATAGMKAPYVLMPHSMSALEAFYWADAYPGEVKKIIGLDMAVPGSYVKGNMAKIAFMKIMTFFGLHRIPAFCHVNKGGLSDDEYRQNKLLTYKNSLNSDVYEECRMVMNNAESVAKLGVPDVPILMFTTNLGHASGYKSWVGAQSDCAKLANDCLQIELDCGHNLHYYKSDFIATEIMKFMKI